MRRTAIAPLAIVAALASLANGWIHLREWLEVYRDLPAAVPGVEVVRYGFPANAVLGLVAFAALLATGLALRSYLRPALIGALAFNAGSLVALVWSRVGTIFGWTEPIWNPAAVQSLVVEIVAVAAIVALGVVVQRTEAGTHDAAATPSSTATARRTDAVAA